MKKIAMILPVAAALAASPAYAQGIGFSPRIEAKIGYDEIAAEFRLDDSAFIETAKSDAVGIALEAGIDANVTERITLGGYASFEFSDANECAELFGSDTVCLSSKRNWSVGARAGMNVGEGGVIFVKGGYSNAKLRASYSESSPSPRPLPFSGSDNASGWHVGAGFEVPIRDGFYVMAEYVHTRYKDVLEDSLASTDSINPSRNQIRGGVGFRFGANR